MGRPSRPLLSRTIITTTAIQLADRRGRFTIPEVAQQLGVSVSSLYHHVRGRDDIIESIREHLAAAMDQVHDDDWRIFVTGWARAYRASFAQHPAVIPLLVGTTVSDPRTLGQYEELAEILHRELGLADADLLVAITMIDTVCLGAALDLAAPEQTWASQDPSSALGAAVRRTNPADRAERAFELQLRLIVDGIAELGTDLAAEGR